MTATIFSASILPIPQPHPIREDSAMTVCITSPQITDLLDRLYADAAQNDPLVHQAVRASGIAHQGGEAAFFKAMRQAYMPISREFGKLLYAQARAARAETIVEFGTSFGLSTIFLAAAVRDQGRGKVIGTEYEAEKAERARANLAAAGLAEWVEIRVGDARETLRADMPRSIDLLLLDGAKSMYLDILTLVELQLRPGAIVASDNTDHDGMADFLAYLRQPANGYLSAALLTQGRQRTMGHEVSVRG
jgi:predicted O-methyltransferase YrrM